jgi:hypothetical protein
MFENIKLDAKLIGAGIFVALCLVVIGVIWFQHREVKNLNVQAGAASSTIAAQAAAASEASSVIVNQQKSNAITDAGNQAIIAAPAQNQAKQDAIQSKTDSAIAQIQTQYNSQPKTDANAKAEDLAIATAQVDGMWQTYCAMSGDTTDPNCAPQATQQ